MSYSLIAKPLCKMDAERLIGFWSGPAVKLIE
jgi:hypothetical protein